jgi:TetR/AcrR family transcriptional regulator, mexJK operon transcriptional repressor
MDVEIAPRTGRKVTDVLRGARTVFLRDGFEGASVDEIAREAGVSKATLYSYFPDKRVLFLEVARRECCAQADLAGSLVCAGRDVPTVLATVAGNFVRFLVSDFGQRVFRICVAESDRFPELGRQFYESGPRVMHEKLVAYLKEGAQRGELAIDDFALAADQFAELCKADIVPRLIFGVTERPTDAEIDRVTEGAVAMFMARYGAGEWSGASSRRGGTLGSETQRHLNINDLDWVSR